MKSDFRFSFLARGGHFVRPNENASGWGCQPTACAHLRTPARLMYDPLCPTWGVAYASYFFRIIVALWPPKPKELDMATCTSALRGVLGT